MRKCKENINISSADIQLRKNQISIVISREPDTPLISELRRQIEELRQMGLDLENIDKKIAEFQPEEVFVNYPSNHQDHIAASFKIRNKKRCLDYTNIKGRRNLV